MTTALTVSPFDPSTAALGERLAVGTLLAASHALAFPEDPPQLPEKNARGLTLVEQDEFGQHFVMWEGERAAAWGMLVGNLKQNTHLVFANVVVHPERRRAGLGRAVAHTLEVAARAQGRVLVTFGTNSRHAGAEPFAARLGAQAALPMRISRLDLHALDAALLRRWQQRPDGDPYRLHLWQTIPDEYLERAAALMMVMNTAPKGDLEIDDWVITPEQIRDWERLAAEAGDQNVLLFAEDSRSGELAGYSELRRDPARPALLSQGATAVRPEARGHGLGKWLKPAMLDGHEERFPGARWVQTGNANVNAAMLGINEALGFAPWAVRTEWQLRLGQGGQTV